MLGAPEYTEEQWNDWRKEQGWRPVDAWHDWRGEDGGHGNDADRYATLEVQREDVPEDVARVLNEMDAILATFQMWPRSDGKRRQKSELTCGSTVRAYSLYTLGRLR